MDLRNIATVKAILAEGSFQKAALRLNCTQSTVTFQVRQLEAELSFKLFERIGRRMALTDEGRRALPHFDSILASVRELKSRGDNGGEPSGELRVGVAESLLSYRMPAVLKAFAKRAPGVKLSLCCLNCNDIRDGIMSGGIDLGVYYDVGGHPATLEVVPLCGFTALAVASPGTAKELRGFGKAGLETDVSFIINEPRSIFREIMERYLKERNIAVRNTMELWSVEAIKKAVASDIGFSFLPRFAVERELRERVLVEVPVDMPTKIVTAVCAHHRNKAQSGAMELFKDLLWRSRDFHPGKMLGRPAAIEKPRG